MYIFLISPYLYVAPLSIYIDYCAAAAVAKYWEHMVWQLMHVTRYCSSGTGLKPHESTPSVSVCMSTEHFMTMISVLCGLYQTKISLHSVRYLVPSFSSMFNIKSRKCRLYGDLWAIPNGSRLNRHVVYYAASRSSCIENSFKRWQWNQWDYVTLIYLIRLYAGEGVGGY